MRSSTSTDQSISVPEATTVNLWERVWRMNGISVVLFFVAAYLVYGSQPKMGGPPTSSSRSTTETAPGS